MSEEEMKIIVDALNAFDKRDQGIDYLNKKTKTKEDLVQLAKYLDKPIQKNDNIEQIRDKVIESTIGYRLRSAAIQG